MENSTAQVNRGPTDWEEAFVMPLTAKRLLFRIQEGPLLTGKRQTCNPIENQKRRRRGGSQKGMMLKRPARVPRDLNMPVVRETQIKATVRCHCASSRVGTYKQCMTLNVREGVCARTFRHIWWECGQEQSFWGQSQVPFDPGMREKHA